MTITEHHDITSPTFLESLDALAWAIDADGLTAHEAAVADVSKVAVRVGASVHLAEVLADGAAPPAARERSFGMLAVALHRAARAVRNGGQPWDASQPEWVLAS